MHSTLPTQTAIKGAKFQIVNVQNAIERKGVISFRVVSGDNQFIDPNNTYVLITLSIKDPAGANIPAEATDAYNPMCNVLPVNGLGNIENYLYCFSCKTITPIHNFDDI